MDPDGKQMGPNSNLKRMHAKAAGGVSVLRGCMGTQKRHMVAEQDPCLGTFPKGIILPVTCTPLMPAPHPLLDVLRCEPGPLESGGAQAIAGRNQLVQQLRWAREGRRRGRGLGSRNAKKQTYAENDVVDIISTAPNPFTPFADVLSKLYTWSMSSGARPHLARAVPPRPRALRVDPPQQHGVVLCRHVPHAGQPRGARQHVRLVALHVNLENLGAESGKREKGVEEKKGNA